MPTKISWAAKAKCVVKHNWHRIHDNDCDFENSHLCLRCGKGKVALKKLKLIFSVKWRTFGLGFDLIFPYREIVAKAGPFSAALTRRHEQ